MVTSESDPLADYNFDSYDEFGVANVDNAPIQQLTDTDVVQDSGAAIEDVADEAEAHFEIDNVAEPIEVEAVQDADNAAIAQDEAPHSDEYDADEKPLYEADNETNVQFEFGDVISEAEFHEYFDANVEPEHPDAIEVESDVFDNVSTVEADAELVFEDGFDADPETPAADTNINVVPGDAVDVNADADFEEPCVAEMVDPPVPEAGETDSKPMPSPERVQFEETAIGADESSGFFECSNVIEEDVPETYVEEGSCVAVKEQSEDPGAGMTDGAVVDSSSGRFQMYNGVVEEVAASKADVKTKVEVDAAFKVPKSNGPDVADDSTKILASVVTDNAEIETADDFVDTKAIAPDSDTKIQSSDAAGDTKFEAPDAIEDAEVGAATEIKVPEAIDDATKVGVPQAAGAVTESADEDDNESIISSGSFKYPMESLPDLAETLKLRDEATKMSATLHKCDEVFTRSNDYMRKSLDDFEAQLAKLAIDQAEQELSIARVGKYVEWAENKLTLIAERQNQRQKHVFDLSKTANMNLSKVTHHLFRDDPIRHLHITLKTMIDSCSHLSELQGAAAHVVCSVWGADVIKTIVGWRAEMFSTKSDDGFIPVPASLIYTMAEMMTVLCGMEDPQHARLVLRDFYNSVTAGMQTFLDGVRHDPSSRPNFEGLIDNPHYYD
uniref:Vps5 domain-containing protein n=1 Tax=Panagrellus redivivus TaxID=6233 RepID=A0A7E4ZTP0_PANRE